MAAQLNFIGDLTNMQPDGLERKWLANIIIGATLHRFYRQLFRRKRANHNNAGHAITPANFLQYAESVKFRNYNIKQNKIWVRGFKHFNGL